MRFSKCFRCKRVLALMVLSFFLLSPVASWACSSVIVGKNASETGRPMIARTADSGITNSRKFIVVPAGFYKAGNHILQANGFNFTFTHDSYKYTAVPNTTRRSITNDGTLGTEATSKDITPHWEDGFAFTHDSAGVNEKGLAVSGTNTTSLRNLTALGGVFGGNSPVWQEPCMAKVLLAEAANCQEALAVVEKILASGQGMGSELIQIADKDEAWIIEAVGRQAYVASRVPDDSFCVIANSTRTQFFDENDPANFRSNFKPNTFAISEDIARYIDGDPTKGVNIAATYGNNVNGAGNTYRVWRGIQLFAPSLNYPALTDADTAGITYPTYFKPDKKISPMDVTRFQRDRYAGAGSGVTDITYSPQILANATGAETIEGSSMPTDLTNYTIKGLPVGKTISDFIFGTNFGVRPAGHPTHRMTHVFETGGELPPEIGARFFLGMGPLETGISLPFYGNITDTHPIHKYDITAISTATTGNGINSVPPDAEWIKDSAFMIFARLGYVARANRTYYVKPIQEFWRAHELKFYEEQDEYIEPELLRQYKSNPKLAAESITDYTMAVSDATFRAAIIILNALNSHIATAPDTLFVVPAAAAAAMEEAHALAPAYVSDDEGKRKTIREILEDHGCNAGFGYLLFAIFAVLPFASRKRK